MKKISLLAIVSLFLGFAGQKLDAQELKFGHIDTDALIQGLPEFETAVARLENLHRELSDALETMQVELNNRAFEYERNAATLTDLVRQAREQELMDMNRRVQEFSQAASIRMQESQAEFFQPIMNNVERAIREVGRENNFLYIFNVSQGGTTLLYFDEARSTDVTALVRAKLGVR